LGSGTFTYFMPKEKGLGNPIYGHWPGNRWTKDVLTYAALCNLEGSDTIDIEGCWHSEIYINKSANAMALGFSALVAGLLYMF